MKLPPCTCGGLVEVERTGPDTWVTVCRSCSAVVVAGKDHDAAVRFEQGQTVLRERTNAQLKFTNGEIRECCKDTRNLVLHGPRYDITVYVCKVCQRKHRRMWAEPGRLGLTLGRIG